MTKREGPEKAPAAAKNGERLRKALGPVANLEDHVRPDWWRYIFNSLYLKTDGDVVDDQRITAREVELYLSLLGVPPEARILDLACGQGRHTLALARLGFKNVEGLDRSHYLITRARAAAKREGLAVDFHEGDARKVPAPADSYDVVLILGNSFGYFESSQEDLAVLKEVRRVLQPWGKLLADIADGAYLRENFQRRSWEWMDKKYFVCRERSLSAAGDRLISREVISHVDKGVVADQFYAERLYTRESLGRLLNAAGFADVTVHGEISPDSDRNQDLGMMEKRLLVTGVVRKERTPVRRKAKEAVTRVVVLLGDPRQPDPLKPATVFDEDDLFTVDRLKAALQEQRSYHFTYLDDHDQFIPELLKLKGRVDYALNFCDEGFDNDARKELHVPTLLEVLGVPYTGSGPQCLAFCYDKSLVRGVAQEMEIPVPAAVFVKPGDAAFELPFSFPAIVKPNFGDSSFGITQQSVAETPEQLVTAIVSSRDQFGYDQPILVEEFLPGKDLSVGIVGNPPDAYTVLPPLEEDYSRLPAELPRLCGYEAKWLPQSPYWQSITSVAAELPDETEKFIVECCLKLFERLACRDYARFDWRLDAAGNPKLLEVNPNPGWCWDGHLAKMAALANVGYAELLGMILKAAEARLGTVPAERKRQEALFVKAAAAAEGGAG